VRFAKRSAAGGDGGYAAVVPGVGLAAISLAVDDPALPVIADLRAAAEHLVAQLGRRAILWAWEARNRPASTWGEHGADRRDRGVPPHAVSRTS